MLHLLWGPQHRTYLFMGGGSIHFVFVTALHLALVITNQLLPA
jgi:hypothetical protein